jgi:hypothetical protein
MGNLQRPGKLTVVRDQIVFNRALCDAARHAFHRDRSPGIRKGTR